MIGTHNILLSIITAGGADPLRHASASPSSSPLPAPSRPGRGRILVMDDDPLIRSFLQALLPHLGYDIQVTQDGVEAVAAYRHGLTTGPPFDAVILDLTVPGGTGGQDAMIQLLTLDPQARGIVSSAYAQEPVMANFRQYGFCAVMAKPYTIAEVSAILQQVLPS